MNPRAALRIVATCIIATFALRPASADTVFYDTFDDLDPADAAPVTWVPQLGSSSVVAGDYVQSGAGPRITIVPEYVLAETSVRAQVRADDDVGVCLGVRRTPGPNGYSGCLTSDGTLDFLRVDGSPAPITLDATTVPLNVAKQDVMLQVDAIGDALRMWAWAIDDPMPMDPQLVVSDATHPQGSVGLISATVGGPLPATATYRFVHVADTHIPDPLTTSLMAGDADQDLDFDQHDLVQVQIAAKYLSGQAATWGEGDWDGAPGGSPGNPPAGDGLFNQFDIIAAQRGAAYLAGPYAAIQPNGKSGDRQTSLVYNPGRGELSVDAPAGMELTSINIDSAAGIFTGQAAENLGGSFDNDADGNIFKSTFGSSFGSLSFGNAVQAGLSEGFLLGDLTVIGSLAGGGDLGNVDLIYVPEPATVLLLSVGLVIGILRVGRKNQRN